MFSVYLSSKVVFTASRKGFSTFCKKGKRKCFNFHLKLNYSNPACHRKKVLGKNLLVGWCSCMTFSLSPSTELVIPGVWVWVWAYFFPCGLEPPIDSCFHNVWAFIRETFATIRNNASLNSRKGKDAKNAISVDPGFMPRVFSCPSP